MYWHLLSYLAPAIIIPTLSSGYPATQKSEDEDPVTLRPIGINDYEVATNLRRRDDQKFEDLDLQRQSQLIYGSPGSMCDLSPLPLQKKLTFSGHGQLLLANMTLFAPDGLEMIMMERFEGLTTAVDCKGDDGTMSLTFKSQQAYQYALDTWSHINHKDDDRFILIANHDGCGPDDERQPYFISKVTPDAGTLTTFLTAQPAPWTEVAGTYDVDFGQAVSLAGSQNPNDDSSPENGQSKDDGKLAARDLWDVLSDIGNGIIGNFDESRTVNVPVNVRNENERSNIYSDGRLTLDCVSCFVAGSFKVSGHIKVHHWSFRQFSISASPVGVHGALVLEAAATGSASITHTTELFAQGIPGAGFVIPKILKLGGVLSYEVGVSATAQGSARVDFGLKASIPDSSKVTLDLAEVSNSGANGFEPSVTPVFDVPYLTGALTLSAFAQPKLFFGIDLLGIGKADLALMLRLPEISATFGPKYDPNGLCSHEPGALQTGVQLSSQIKIALIGEAEASFLGHGKDWTKELWGWSHPLADACLPLKIPGIIPRVPINWKDVPFLHVPVLKRPPKLFGLNPSFFSHAVPTALPVVHKSSSLYLPSALQSSISQAATANPYATYPAGGLPGVYPSGAYSTGALPTGIFPTAPYPSGVFPTGIYPTGVYPTGTAFPSGYTRTATLNAPPVPTKLPDA